MSFRIYHPQSHQMLHMYPLPRLVVVSDGISDSMVEKSVISLLDSGRNFWLHLRDLWAADVPFEAAVARIVDHIVSLQIARITSVNSRLDTAVKFKVGYHASGRGPWIPTAREQLAAGLPIGASVHSPEEARIAEKAQADYVVFSPVYPSRGIKGHPGLGVEMLKQVAGSVAIPVYALGGLTPDRVGECMQAGAYGVGALSGIFESGSAPAAVDEFNAALG